MANAETDAAVRGRALCLRACPWRPPALQARQRLRALRMRTLAAPSSPVVQPETRDGTRDLVAATAALPASHPYELVRQAESDPCGIAVTPSCPVAERPRLSELVRTLGICGLLCARLQSCAEIVSQSATAS